MSIIEDGEIAEVLYLIPKQSMLQHLPFINPDDYYLCEELSSLPSGLGEYAPLQCQGCLQLSVGALMPLLQDNGGHL